MTGGRAARARGRSTLWTISTAVFLAAIAGSASANEAASTFIAPDSPPSYVPEGSTWVPQRDNLGAAALAGDSTPQSIGTLCKPNVGTPTTPPSQLDVALSPTTGIIVSSQGYLTFLRSDPAGCATKSFSAWSTLFTTAPGDAIFSEPRVIYDSHVDKFGVAILVKSPGASTFQLYIAIAGSDGVAASAVAVPGIIVSGSNVLQDLSLGYDINVWLVALDYTASGTLYGAMLALNKTTGAQVGAVVTTVSHPVAPIVLDNAATGYFLAVDTSAKNQIRRIVPNFSTGFPDSTTAISVTAFDLPPAVTQSNGATLAADDGNFHAPTVQIGTSLWNVHTVGVGGHARVRMYRLDTTATSPLTTFTPMIDGNEDIFAPSVATVSNAAGSAAFLTATYNNFSMPGSPLYALAFSGPNDATSGWTYDVIGSDTNFTASGSQWATHSATWMNPGDTSAWGFGQLASGSAATNWSIAGAEITSPGAPFAAPIASAATGIGSDHFTANWSATSPAATAYMIDVATDSGFTSLVSGYQAKNVGNVTSADVSGLSKKRTYYYRVRAAGASLSGSSNTIDVATTAVGPLELLALALLAFGGLGLRRRRA